MCEEKKRYHTTIYVKDEYGRPVRKFIGAKTEKELKEKVRHIKNDIEDGKDVLKEGVFGAWADNWLNKYKIPQGLSKNTITEYKSAISHLNRYFEFTPISDIKFEMFQGFINDMALCNPNTGKESSKQLLRVLRVTAENIFSYASMNGVSSINTGYFKFIKIPKIATKEERRALTEEEIRMIIDTPHRAQPIAMTMLFAGLRRGEALALEWKQVDLVKGVIKVTQSAEYDNNRVSVKQGGKTAAATRKIPIPPILKSFLAQYRFTQPVIASGKYDFVFPNTKGEQLTPGAFNKMWNSYICDLNVKYGFEGQNVSKFTPNKLPMRIERFTAHYLRHTFATMLYLQGIDLQTAKQYLGHNDIDVTSDIYTDLKNNSIIETSEEYKQHLQTDYSVKIG